MPSKLNPPAKWLKIIFGDLERVLLIYVPFMFSVFQDKDWDTSVQFLPASDNKKLEKKKGPGKVGAVVGVVIFAAVIALMTGLLVWHFHCEYPPPFVHSNKRMHSKGVKEVGLNRTD